jgi:hypothetical protein
MTMPKGFKSKNGYATTTELGGKSYQQIANIMTERGYVMNHSTARNLCVNGLKKIVAKVIEQQGITMTDANIKRVAKDPRFQSGLCDILKDG